MKERYRRNRIYVDAEEQEKVREFGVFLGGAGIGSIISECALRFGFETLTIVDGDKVEESNLNRQNYRICDIGKPKVEALKERLLSINPSANITAVNIFIDKDNMVELLEGHSAAINALDFSSNVPFLFDAHCRQCKIPVLHPYNLGWGGLVMAVSPDGPQLSELSDDHHNFEVRLVQRRIIDYFRFWGRPKRWLEDIMARYKVEKGPTPPPQLSVASWIVGGLCTNLLFCLATGYRVKWYPDFYLSSIIEDQCLY